MVTIKRKTGWLGMGSKTAITLNGETVVKAQYNQEIRLDIPRDGARLKVKGFGYKSNEIEVKDGDIVELTTPIWSYILFLLAILSPSLLSIFIDSYMPIIALAVLIISSAFFVNDYKLRIIDKSRVTSSN